jgi:hypothetical protein
VGRGLSPLQHEILVALNKFPSYEELEAKARRTGHFNLKLWARPSQILRLLGREPDPNNRASLSRALTRLCQRGLVSATQPLLFRAPGRSWFYVLTKKSGLRKIPARARAGAEVKNDDAR